MFKIIGQKISLTRGDTANIDLTIQKSTDEKYILTGNDKVYLTVKESASDIEYKFQKVVNYASVLEDGSIHIKILPADTKNLEFMEYTYDIELKTTADDVFTIIPNSPFVITPEVTYSVNEG